MKRSLSIFLASVFALLVASSAAAFAKTTWQDGAPDLKRWLTVDPLSEKYYGETPYAYCANNPVNLVDPDGMQWYSSVGSSPSTLQVGAFQPKRPWYSKLFSNGEKNYLGNVYWNTKNLRSPDVDTSLSCIFVMPNAPSINPSFTTKNMYYWLRASNPLNGVNAGFQTHQLLFSPVNAKAFMQSYNNIFAK